MLFIRYSNFLRRKLDAGEAHNGIIAWLTAIVPVIVLFLLLHLLLAKLAPVLAFLMNLGVLYLCGVEIGPAAHGQDSTGSAGCVT